MTVLGKLWRGEYALPVAFWVFYCVGLFAAYLVAGIFLFLSRTIDAHQIALGMAFVLVCAYWLAATVGVWRSARPYWTSPIWMQRIWAALARGVVAVWFVKVLWRLIDGGALGLVQRIAGDTGF